MAIPIYQQITVKASLTLSMFELCLTNLYRALLDISGFCDPFSIFGEVLDLLVDAFVDEVNFLGIISFGSALLLDDLHGALALFPHVLLE